jgi:cephalosporin hydroxylase
MIQTALPFKPGLMPKQWRVDTETQELTFLDESGRDRSVPLYGEEAFRILNHHWTLAGWNLKYSYRYTWMGRPVIQLPEDMLRLQEAIFRVQPDVIVETGIAYGGGLIYYASLCKAMGKGRVIGIDIEIRPHNRQALEAHPLFEAITLLEGSSTDPEILKQVRAMIQPGERVLVILDSCHTKAHVAEELEQYHSLVTPGSYIIATDGVMEDLAVLPDTDPDWAWNNPAAAAREFAATHPEFILEENPPALFNESKTETYPTYWPSAWLKRK